MQTHRFRWDDFVLTAHVSRCRDTRWVAGASGIPAEGGLRPRGNLAPPKRDGAALAVIPDLAG